MNIYNASEIKDTKGTFLIYGAPGMGKTTSFKYFPGKTLVLDIDRTSKVLKGCSNIDILEVDNMNTWDSWQEIVVTLYKEYQGKYDNIAVDNISELERCILADLGSKGKNKGVPAQGDYQYMQFKLTSSLRCMKEMRSNVIWTAWESTDLYIDSSGTQYNRSYPQINNKILNNILGLCDVVARLSINSENERGFYLSATNSTYAKNQRDNRVGCLQNELIVGDLDESTKTLSSGDTEQN